MKRRSFFTGITAALVAVAVELRIASVLGERKQAMLYEGLAVAKVIDDPVTGTTHVTRRWGSLIVDEFTLPTDQFNKQGGLHKFEHVPWDKCWKLNAKGFPMVDNEKPSLGRTTQTPA